MRDNGFGTTIKVVLVLWMLLCGWGFADSCTNVLKGVETATDAHTFALLFGFFLWGGLWVVPSLGLYLLYRMFGRSQED